MQILVIGKFYEEAFARHIAETLIAMGHAVHRFEPGFKAGRWRGSVGYRVDQVRQTVHSVTDAVPAVRKSRIRQLWSAVAGTVIDLTIVTHDFLLPQEVTELKRVTRSPVALWFPDSMAAFGKSMFMNAPYDGLFFTDPFIVQTLGRVLHVPVFYLPECCNPVRHSLPESEIGEDPAYRCEVTTAGNQHAWRVAFYSHLSSYDVKLWGHPPPLWMRDNAIRHMHQGRLVYNADKVRAFRGAKIVVNNLLFSEVWGVNARTFEAAAAGAFQMVDWRPGLSQLFADGKEIVSFRDIRDLRKEIDYWLPREQERREIAAAGMRRAHAEHTYAMRLALLVDTIGGRAGGFPMPRIHVEEAVDGAHDGATGTYTA